MDIVDLSIHEQVHVRLPRPRTSEQEVNGAEVGRISTGAFPIYSSVAPTKYQPNTGVYIISIFQTLREESNSTRGNEEKERRKGREDERDRGMRT